MATSKNITKLDKMAEDELKNKNNFLISLNGQIHSAFFPFFDDVYCKYSFVCGPDWVIVSGVEEGISQISKKGRDEEQLFIWNLPLNIVFKSTNPFGWPQLVISAYGSDVFDNEVVRGYGVCHIPITPGACEKEIPMFVPESSSVIQKFTSWLTGRRPEFIDPRILTQADAREEMAPDITGVQERKAEVIQCQIQRRNLHRESERLKTLKNWPASFLDSKKLAKGGFYYTGTGDVVKCAFCDVQIGCWEDGDDPEKDHLENSPDCPFLKGEECGNRELSESGEGTEGSNDEETTSQDVCGTYGLELRPFSAPERPVKNPLTIEANNLWRNFEELGVSKVSGPVSPQYATHGARIKTYENWPGTESLSPERMADAGFYYTGYKDNVLCYHCGGGLRNWEVEDDPWSEHARWFSRCGYVIMRKGKLFVLGVLAKQKLLTESLEKKESTEEAERGAKAEAERQSETSSTKRSSCSTPPASSSASNSDEESQRSQNPDGKEIALCRICYVKERGIVFLPCGHFVSCTDCAPSLSSCAVCRKPFEATVRAYLS